MLLRSQLDPLDLRRQHLFDWAVFQLFSIAATGFAIKLGDSATVQVKHSKTIQDGKRAKELLKEENLFISSCRRPLWHLLPSRTFHLVPDHGLMVMQVMWCPVAMSCYVSKHQAHIMDVLIMNLVSLPNNPEQPQIWIVETSSSGFVFLSQAIESESPNHETTLIHSQYGTAAWSTACIARSSTCDSISLSFAVEVVFTTWYCKKMPPQQLFISVFSRFFFAAKAQNLRHMCWALACFFILY